MSERAESATCPARCQSIGKAAATAQARGKACHKVPAPVRQLVSAGYQARGEVLLGETVDEITKYAKKIEADLIVVGHKHLDGWAARWWRGSVSKSLIEHAPCSVLVVIVH